MVYLPELIPALAAVRLDIVEMHNDRRNYYLWAKLGHERWVARKAEVVTAADEITWRRMRVLFAGAAHVMATSPGGTTAYRGVLESRAPRSERGDGRSWFRARDAASPRYADQP